jgi:hypothetical protein
MSHCEDKEARIMRRAALPLVLVLALAAAGCGGQASGPSVWFVHATDPHLFLLPKPTQVQQKLIQRDFANLLAAAGWPAEAPARPAFLVLTGDLGLEALSVKALPKATAQADRDAGIKQIADALRASPLKDVYFVLGNNDVYCEQAMGANVKEAEDALGEINQQLGGQVTLHDLTSCYQAPLASSLDGCTADVGAGYRLIGFPSQSFKTLPKGDECAAERQTAKAPPGSAPPANTAPASGTTAAASGGAAASGIPPTREAQQKLQVATFLKLTAKAAADGKKVLVVTHTPELDDPFGQAQGLFAGKFIDGSQRPEWARWSAWDVSPEIRDQWRQQVDSDLVAGVLAGHFHDSHREVYYPPYAWSAAAGGRARKEKYLLAPPLSIKLQDASPYQARGFSLVRLEPNRIWRRLYWYDGHAAFVPDPVAAAAAASRPASGRGSGGWLGPSWSWLWQVASDKERLPRAALVAIALLVAFLTVVQVWQIPPPSTTTATPAAAAQAPAAAGAAGAAGAPGGNAAGGGGGGSSGAKFGPFDNNFANTVFAGLLGMLGVTALNPLWDTKSFDPKLYYLLLFVVFFLSLLLLSAFLRAVTEALRSRILLPVAPDYHEECPPDGSTPRWARAGRAVWRWLQRKSHRWWRWMVSLRTPLLVFADTFYHVIQGKNQLQTAIFDSSIRDLQLSLALAVDKTARSVHRAAIQALRNAKTTPGESDVRVNVSVMSDDGQSLYYVSWEPGSSSRLFPTKSVAWVAVRAGQARWWKQSYTAGSPPPEIVLYEGPALPPLADPQPKLKLVDYIQDRGAIDYQAFIVLPIPWRRRDGGTRRLAGLHISFKAADLMEAIWHGLDDGVTPPKVDYSTWTQLLNPLEPQPPASPPAFGAAGYVWIKDESLRQVLDQALAVLAEVLRPFNETIFQDYVKQRK